MMRLEANGAMHGQNPLLPQRGFEPSLSLAAGANSEPPGKRPVKIDLAKAGVFERVRGLGCRTTALADRGIRKESQESERAFLERFRPCRVDHYAHASFPHNGIGIADIGGGHDRQPTGPVFANFGG